MEIEITSKNEKNPHTLIHAWHTDPSWPITLLKIFAHTLSVIRELFQTAQKRMPSSPATATHDRNITTPRTFNLRFHHIRIPYSCARGRVCGARILGLSEGARSPLRLGHPSGLGGRGRACQGVRINPVRGPLRLRFGRGGQFSDWNRPPEVERPKRLNYTRMRVKW